MFDYNCSWKFVLMHLLPDLSDSSNLGVRRSVGSFSIIGRDFGNIEVFGISNTQSPKTLDGRESTETAVFGLVLALWSGIGLKFCWGNSILHSGFTKGSWFNILSWFWSLIDGRGGRFLE